MTKEMKVKIYSIRMKENQKRNSMTKERSEKLKVPTRHTSWPDCCDEETNKQNTEKWEKAKEILLNRELQRNLHTKMCKSEKNFIYMEYTQAITQ